MHHRLKWFIHLRAQGLSKGDEQPTNTPHGVWYSLRLPCGNGVTLVNEVALRRARLVPRWVTVSRVCRRIGVNHGRKADESSQNMELGNANTNWPQLFKNISLRIHQNTPFQATKSDFFLGPPSQTHYPSPVAPTPTPIKPSRSASATPEFQPVVVVAFK